MEMTVCRTKCRALARELETMADKLESHATLRCGWFSDEGRYPGGQAVSEVARHNEFGTAKIPPRPFVRPAIAANGDRWLLHLAQGIKKVLNGEIDSIHTVMWRLGHEVVVDLKDSIMRVWSPPLAPATIARRIASPHWSKARKGRHQAALYKPLVDTATMIQQTSARVEGD